MNVSGGKVYYVSKNNDSSPWFGLFSVDINGGSPKKLCDLDSDFKP